MHIAMLSGEYPPRWGGMGSTVFHLSAALVKLGHRVTVITRREAEASRNPDVIPRQQGVSVRMVKWAKLPMAFTRSYGRHALRDLLQLHNDDPVDAVHLHCPMISWDATQFQKVKAEIPNIVSSLHGSWLGERDGMVLAAKFGEAATWKNPNDLAILLTAKHYAKFERAALRGSTVCVANSEATKADFLSRYDPPSDWRCEVERWGVDVEMFHPLNRDHEESLLAHEAMRKRYGRPDEMALSGLPETETPLILAVGRLVGRKGFLTLLRAMPTVLSSQPRAHLVIVGRGHMRNTLLRQAKRLGVADAVSIESGMPFADLAQLFRSADLVAYPSYYEGQGLIPLEAMASGTPVVTVDHGPLPEMVDDSVGSLFEMGDIDSMADAILMEMSDRTTLLEKGEAGRRRVLERFTYNHDAERFIEIYGRASGK